MDKPTQTTAEPVPTPDLPPLPLTPAQARLFDACRKVPPASNNLALQIVALQARVWTADQDDNACRPWYMLCLELYPRGTVTNQSVHRPVSVRPSASALLTFLLTQITSPPPGEPAVCPRHVSFVDPTVTAVLRKHLSRLKIHVDTLTLADGVSEYIHKFSDRLIARDQATRSDSAERPGLLSAPNVKPPLVAALQTAAVELFDAAPWSRIPEHLALQVRLPIQHPRDPYRRKFFATVLGSSDNDVLGFALMPSLDALRHKYRRSMAAQMTEGMPDPPAAHINDVLVCAACGRRVGEGTKERYVNRCTGCRRVLYCNERCQKIDWRKRHRYECKEAAQNKDYVFKRKEWDWLSRELALLFLDPTAVPFDDLDAWEQHGWRFVDSTSPPLYALPFVSVQQPDGFSSRRDLPTAEEMEIFTFAAKALIECDAPPPPEGTLHLANGVSVSIAENLAESVPVS